MAKKPKIRFSGYYPAAVIQAIKSMAEKEGLSENEAAAKLLEAGIKATAAKDEPAGPPKGLKGIDLTIWKAEQKSKS